MTPLSVLLHTVLALAMLFSSIVCSAQEHTSFESDEKIKNLYLSKVEDVNKLFINDYQGEYKKEFKKYFKKRADDAEYLVEEDIYLFEPTSLEYLNGLKNKIADANPHFDFSNIFLVIARYPWANAYSTGDGTIAIIPELVTYYESEDEFIFILCHEFAHYLAQHSERKLERFYAEINSEEFKSKEKEIKKTKYGQTTKLTELINENLYSQKEHSREYEREADSLGLVLYRNTQLCLKSAYLGIQRLSLIEKSIKPRDSLIYNRLGLPEVSRPGIETINVKDKDRDWKWEKVKSHPDVPERVEWLKQQANIVDDSICPPRESSDFEEFKTRMEFEACNVFVTNEVMDAALIRAERLRIEYPESDYLKAIGAYCMYTMYHGRKHHELSHYCRPSSKSIDDPDLRKLLNSVYHSRLTKLRKSTYNYLKNNYSESQKDERYLVAYARMIEEVGGVDEKTFTELKNKYLKLYPDGDYADNFPYHK